MNTELSSAMPREPSWNRQVWVGANTGINESGQMKTPVKKRIEPRETAIPLRFPVPRQMKPGGMRGAVSLLPRAGGTVSRFFSLSVIYRVELGEPLLVPMQMHLETLVFHGMASW